MARLSAAERAALPDRAFAYVDSAGKRRLPIYDESHVRNALARFDQVHFETERARDAARRRLLNAAKRFKIVPVGFIASQLEGERDHTSRRGRELPDGFVTMVMTDIEGSTNLLDRLAERYADLLDAVRDLQSRATDRCNGQVVEARADELFAVFRSPRDGLDATLAIQRDLAARADELAGQPVRVRIGVHSGYPTKRQANYVGMAVHTTARVCDAAHGGQIVVTDDVVVALTGMPDDDIAFRSLGVHQLRGIPGEVRLHQVEADGLRNCFEPLRI